MTLNPNGQRNSNETPRKPKKQKAIVQTDDCFEDYDGPCSKSFHVVNDRHSARATFADPGSDTASQALSVEPETQVSEEEDQYTDQESADSDTWSTATLLSDVEPAPQNQHEAQYQSSSPPSPPPPPPPLVYLNNAYHQHEHHETHGHDMILGSPRNKIFHLWGMRDQIHIGFHAFQNALHADLLIILCRNTNFMIMIQI
ncbi:uncharacterized protein EAF01_000602 [Botrytis porri]|uniref:uncharacterized protein n=1 Tax=Botrytis porri TaxID=87229 RepID=UPI0019008ED1|nr:uncharacterized protein EAF01_000602 [Botrytis porri]KAF7914196.1 hypothetical protein EAF01_000602 [Botrytis porri]